MAKIRTQNGGKVILRDGRVSCECCEIDLGDINFADPEDCDCENIVCYDAQDNPSPSNLTIGGISYPNRDPGTNRFVINTLLLQGPIYENGNTNLPIIGWQNYFSQPSLVRITGQVGGDIALEQLQGLGSTAFASAAGITFPEDWNSVYRMNDLIPNDGEFPCGECETPRNGPHNIDYTFPLWPFTYFRVRPWTYVECSPFFRLRLRRVGPLPP